MLTLYGDLRSGNCYKVQLMLALLARDYHFQSVDILNRENREHEFLAKNPNGKIPVLGLDDGSYLAESNAILYYLGRDSIYFPQELRSQAKVMQWLFFEQYSHEPYIAVARFIQLYLGLPDSRKEEYAHKQAGGHKALSLMQSQLLDSPYLCGDYPSIADIALYAYTHRAHEGGFDLARYPAIQAWCMRIESLPGYQPMQC
ncbi:glutathione S-transferase family protein [Aliiglaciecola sp. CAU 1673]|uniref:glutathione S-transferase family protein n=1 Tax=Aliiglaciecola sp. CAU 1673 TaxID=3032595 RepID=UPI0023DB2DAC|nr:glutathione S-transferase family protein [Aliiglaciecola sp. CAU 1673]MDF2179965.1 glutathione S-transferase family protein [Aliiglaciecola sp. CAU 1673]